MPWDTENPGRCSECDPSFGCFNGSAPCSKTPYEQPATPTPDTRYFRFECKPGACVPYPADSFLGGRRLCRYCYRDDESHLPAAPEPAPTELPCPGCGRPMARVGGPAERRGWTCVNCNSAGDPEEDHLEPAAPTPEPRRTGVVTIPAGSLVAGETYLLVRKPAAPEPRMTVELPWSPAELRQRRALQAIGAEYANWQSDETPCDVAEANQALENIAAILGTIDLRQPPAPEPSAELQSERTRADSWRQSCVAAEAQLAAVQLVARRLRSGEGPVDRLIAVELLERALTPAPSPGAGEKT